MAILATPRVPLPVRFVVRLGRRCLRSPHCRDAVVKIEFKKDAVDYANLVEYFFRIHDASTLNRQGTQTSSLHLLVSIS
jgi:hypothetical protein